MTTMQDKGILLIAVGHPYYSHMASNLAVSIRYHNPELPVAIAHDGQGFSLLEEWQKTLFTEIEIPKKLLNGDPYSLKLHLDELTPFKKTLFLDVDMVWNNDRTVSQLMDELDGVPFTMVCRSVLGKDSQSISRWVDMKEMAEAFKSDEFYDISSELIYFDGSPTIFEEARKAYKKPKVKVAPFGQGLADEAFFMMALAKTGVKPHSVPFEPTYWEPRYFPRQHNRAFISQFYALSVGGAFNTPHIKKIYDSLMLHYFNSLGIAAKPYQLQPKSRIIKERRKI